MKKAEYYTSKEVKTYLKIQDCDLAHTRQADKLKYKKSGKSYLYCKDSVLQLKKENLK
jgi:hypothetical protein